MKTFLLLFSAVIIACSVSIAQAPDWLWAKATGGPNDDRGNSIAIDASGNVYTTGLFWGTVDFDPGAGTFNLTSTIGWSNMFISKLNNSGNFVWAKAITGTGISWGSAIAVDLALGGNIYTTGLFTGTVDFDPGVGTFNLTSTGGNDIFITKFDSAGNFIWARKIGGTDHDIGQSLAIDVAGNVYITGYFTGTVDFDPDAGIFNLTSVGGTYEDIFISKLDSTGNFVWAKAMGGSWWDYGYCVAIDASGYVYSTGYFTDMADFDPGVGTFNLTSVSGSFDIFISKLDCSGNFIWAKAIGGNEDDGGNFLAIDLTNSGDVFTTGIFLETVDFDPGTGTYNLNSAGNSADIFISRLDSAGNFVWAKSMGGLYDDVSNAIALDPLGSGDVYTTGFFQGTADFNPGIGAFNLTDTGNYGDIFISKLNSLGDFMWAKATGGSSHDVGTSIALNASGSVQVTGYFHSPTIIFNSTTITNANNSGSYSDIFIAKLDTTTIMTVNNEIENFGKGSYLYPNPFNNSTTILFTLEQSQKVSLKVFDLNGRLISTLADKYFEAGEQQLEFNAEKLNAGIYFLKMQTDGFAETEKLVVTK